MTTQTYHAVLSERLAVDFRYDDSGLRCEWHSAIPAALTDDEQRVYLRERNMFIAGVARSLNQRIVLGDLTPDGVSRLLCFHPDGFAEVLR